VVVGESMRILTYGRFADRFPPERELLRVDDDGTFSMWRSFGTNVIGRFKGSLPDFAEFESLVKRAAGSRVPEPEERDPDGSEVEITAGDEKTTFPADFPPDGPWGELDAACRGYLDSLRSEPNAAIEGELQERARVFRLSHRGTEELPLELGRLRVRVVRWHEGREAAVAEMQPQDEGHVDAGPGWQMEVRVEPQVDGEGRIVAEATFVADDGGVYVPVTVTAHYQPG
jgi:hypothetical protein